MLIAKVNSKGLVEKVAPYTDFGGFVEIPSQKDLKDQGYRVVSVRKSFDKTKEKLVASVPYLEEPWVYTVKVEKLSKEELKANQEASIQEIRDQRDLLLSESDWSQAADVPLSEAKKTEWKKYRQELRDITKKFSQLKDVVWPNKP